MQRTFSEFNSVCGQIFPQLYAHVYFDAQELLRLIEYVRLIDSIKALWDGPLQNSSQIILGNCAFKPFSSELLYFGPDIWITIGNKRN